VSEQGPVGGAADGRIRPSNVTAPKGKKARYLPPIIRADDLVSALLRAGRGSDLASITSRAVIHRPRLGAERPEVWTSGAGVSDLGLILARTVPSSRGPFGPVLLHCADDQPRRRGATAPEMSGAYHFKRGVPLRGRRGSDALIGTRVTAGLWPGPCCPAERSAIGGGTSGRSVGDSHSDRALRDRSRRKARPLSADSRLPLRISESGCSTSIHSAPEWTVRPRPDRLAS